MPVVGFFPLRLLAVVFGAWKAKEKQVEGTYSGDTRGYGDDVDLDTVVDKVSTLMRAVRKFSGVRPHAMKCTSEDLRGEWKCYNLTCSR